MKTVTRVVNWMLWIVCAILLIGCGQNGNEGIPNNSLASSDQDIKPFKEVAKLKQGLNIITQKEGEELVIGYREGNNAVYFQTLRGEQLVFGENTIDPDAPQYEISTRVVNINGDPISVAIGGDHNGQTIGWLDPVTGLYTDYINIERGNDLKLAAKAVDILSKDIVGFDEDILALKQHIDAAIADSNTVENENLRNSKATSTWTYLLRIMRKNATYFDKVGDHSALWVRLTRPDGSTFSYATCNHGTCADSSEMQLSSQRSFAKSSQLPVVDFMPCDNAGYSYAIVPYYHVCNDDTYVQYSTLAYGNTSTATCHDSYVRVYAPVAY